MLINLLRDEGPTRCRRVRRVSADLPLRAVPGVQGESQLDTGRVSGADRDHQGGARRTGHHGAGRAWFRSRRHHRDSGHPGRGAPTIGFLSSPETATRCKLVSDNVTVLYPRKVFSDLTQFTPTQSSKYGLTPKQYPDFAALRGDPATTARHPGRGERPRRSGSSRIRLSAGLVDNVGIGPRKSR